MLKEIPTKLEAKISVGAYQLINDVIQRSKNFPETSLDYVSMHNQLMQLVEEKIIPQGNQAWYQGLVLYLKNEYDKKIKGEK